MFLVDKSFLEGLAEIQLSHFLGFGRLHGLPSARKSLFVSLHFRQVVCAPFSVISSVLQTLLSLGSPTSLPMCSGNFSPSGYKSRSVSLPFQGISFSFLKNIKINKIHVKHHDTEETFVEYIFPYLFFYISPQLGSSFKFLYNLFEMILIL